MKEDDFVGLAYAVAQEVLPERYSIKRGLPLLYQIQVSNKLQVNIDPRNPVRGQSAFETDLCVVEHNGEGLEIPRIVIEFKTKLTTHDILTYTAKARKHKQIYPYLRYGMLLSQQNKIPGRFFNHNEAIDFCFAAGNFQVDTSGLSEFLRDLFTEEIEASSLLEDISYGTKGAFLYREKIFLK